MGKQEDIPVQVQDQVRAAEQDPHAYERLRRMGTQGGQHAAEARVMQQALQHLRAERAVEEQHKAELDPLANSVDDEGDVMHPGAVSEDDRMAYDIGLQSRAQQKLTRIPDVKQTVARSTPAAVPAERTVESDAEALMQIRRIQEALHRLDPSYEPHLGTEDK